MDASNGPQAEPDRRQRIIGAAFGLFAERGYHGATTREIAARAHVSKRDLYALFGDKAAILTACIAERAEQMNRPLRLPTPPTRAALEATLLAFGTTLLQELSRPSTIAAYRLAIAEAERAPEVARALQVAGQMAVRQAAIDLLASCIVAGLVAGDPAVLADVFFDALQTHSLVLRLLLRLVEPPDAPTIDARARAATQAVLMSATPE